MAYDINTIMKFLLMPVPSAPRPMPKPRKTFAKLRVGKHLRDAQGREWMVSACDTQGADLTLVSGDVENLWPIERLETRDWQELGWSVVRRASARKGLHRPLPPSDLLDESSGS